MQWIRFPDGSFLKGEYLILSNKNLVLNNFFVNRYLSVLIPGVR